MESNLNTGTNQTNQNLFLKGELDFEKTILSLCNFHYVIFSLS